MEQQTVSSQSIAENTDLVIYYQSIETSLGQLLVGVTDRGVCAILIGTNTDELLNELNKRFVDATVIPAANRFDRWISEVTKVAENPLADHSVPIDLHGTPFQKRVWNALLTIPAGSTQSYTEIAKKIGAPKSYRAVAQACGANHVAILIPCHRVLRSDGSLSGYRWGVDRKAELLQRETVRH